MNSALAHNKIHAHTKKKPHYISDRKGPTLDVPPLF